jgi:pimeloyl-ACP methyl ester carboxylesterase
VDVPTLIVAGDRDRFTPTWLSRRMALEIPPPSCSWCEVGATPRFWSDRRK